MRLLVTGGGTGGHVYPALSVVEALRAGDGAPKGGHEIAWVGAPESIEERILAREGVTFYQVPTGAIRGGRPLQVVANLGRVVRGVCQARRVLGGFRPDVVLATGGYVSVPLVVAARLTGCPSLLYLPDMVPGVAVRFLSRLSSRVAVTTEAAAERLPAGKITVTGYPVRRALYTLDTAEARAELGLAGSPRVLLVLGGSRGAHTINVAVAQGLVQLLRGAQLVHICGEADHKRLSALREELDVGQRGRYHLYPYLHEQMPQALVSADLVVARAGAAVLGEFPAVGIPAILVPYPYAGQHQQLNADYMASHEAAFIVQDGDLGTSLVPAIDGLLEDPERLQAMSIASRALAAPDAAQAIVRELEALVESRSDE